MKSTLPPNRAIFTFIAFTFFTFLLSDFDSSVWAKSKSRDARAVLKLTKKYRNLARQVSSVRGQLANLLENSGEDTPPNDVFPAQGMVWIKPGTFLMGSRADEPGRDPDETQYWVTLTKGFWMSVHEVTQAEYVAVTGLTNPSNFLGDTRPVENVSWYDAVAYCEALTAAEAAAGRIPAGWAYRLPTEAEWEYCSRAGARNTRFGFGDDLSASALEEYAWHSSNSGSTTHSVEQKRGNAWGLMDMHGNINEWCHDRYGDYPSASATDPQGAASGSNRVLRGGSWFNGADVVRCASRYNDIPSLVNSRVGFRLVLGPVQPWLDGAGVAE